MWCKLSNVNTITVDLQQIRPSDWKFFSEDAMDFLRENDEWTSLFSKDFGKP